MLNRAVRNAAFNGLATLGQFVVSFLFTGLTIRFLGDQRAGYLLTLQGLIALGGTAGGFGLGTAAIRRIAILYSEGKRVESRQYLGIVLLVNLLVGFSMSGLIVLAFPWIFEWSKIDSTFLADARSATVFIAAAFVLQQAASAYNLTLASLQRYDLVALVNTLFGFLSGGLGLLVLGFSRNMTSLAALSFGLGLVQLMVNGIFSRHLLGSIATPQWDWSRLRSLSSFGAWVYAGSVSGLLVSNLDKIVLTTFLGSQSLPYYVIGQRVYQQVHSALAGQSEYIFPMLSGSQQSSGSIRSIEHRLRWFVGFGSAIIYGGLVILSHWLLDSVIGPEFTGRAYAPFLIFCVVGFLHAQMIVPWNTSWAGGEAKPNSVMQFVNGILVLLTTILLAPQFGVLGASAAQLWIGPIMVGHVSWVLMCGRRFSFEAIYSPLVTPAISFLLLLWVSVFTRESAKSYPFEMESTVLVASVAAVLMNLFVEWRMFRKYECVSTLWRASAILFSKLARQAAKSSKR
jgi:O-antigen/teichoic acid export membrane protein